MKTKFKRIASLALGLVLALALAAPALAADPATLTNGVAGAWDTKDTPKNTGEVITITKELTAFNVDGTDNDSGAVEIFAPTISYTYTIASGDANKDVIDLNTNHSSNTSVSVKTKAGVGTPTISGPVAWAASETIKASSIGYPNTKTFTIDFSGVDFGAAGVYRYVITEALTTSGDTYAMSGVTETSDATNGHTRYLDVYVKPSENYATETEANQWDVYGFVCIYNNAEKTTADSTNTAVKTNGFVPSKDSVGTGANDVTADRYYTWNLEISKKVENDAYAKTTHAFPFSVIFFNNGDGTNTITKNVDLKTTVASGATDFTRTAGVPTWSGVAALKDSTSIKYIGIPQGVDAEVYETNDVTGVTYKVTSTRTNATSETATDNSVTEGATPSGTQSAQTSPKPDYQSTKTEFNTNVAVSTDTALANKSVAITNYLELISPTGVVTRIAPFAILLGAGVVLLMAASRRREEEEDA